MTVQLDDAVKVNERLYSFIDFEYNEYADTLYLYLSETTRNYGTVEFKLPMSSLNPVETEQVVIRVSADTFSGYKDKKVRQVNFCIKAETLKTFNAPEWLKPLVDEELFVFV